MKVYRKMADDCHAAVKLGGDPAAERATAKKVVRKTRKKKLKKQAKAVRTQRVQSWSSWLDSFKDVRTQCPVMCKRF